MEHSLTISPEAFANTGAAVRLATAKWQQQALLPYILTLHDSRGLIQTPEEAQNFLARISKAAAIPVAEIQILHVPQHSMILFKYEAQVYRCNALFIDHISDFLIRSKLRTSIPFVQQPETTRTHKFGLMYKRLYDGNPKLLLDKMFESGRVYHLKISNGRKATTRHPGSPPGTRTIEATFWTQRGEGNWVAMMGRLRSELDCVEGRIDWLEKLEAQSKEQAAALKAEEEAKQKRLQQQPDEEKQRRQQREREKEEKMQRKSSDTKYSPAHSATLDRKFKRPPREFKAPLKSQGKASKTGKAVLTLPLCEPVILPPPTHRALGLHPYKREPEKLQPYRGQAEGYCRRGAVDPSVPRPEIVRDKHSWKSMLDAHPRRGAKRALAAQPAQSDGEGGGGSDWEGLVSDEEGPALSVFDGTSLVGTVGYSATIMENAAASSSKMPVGGSNVESSCSDDHFKVQSSALDAYLKEAAMLPRENLTWEYNVELHDNFEDKVLLDPFSSKIPQSNEDEAGEELAANNLLDPNVIMSNEGRHLDRNNLLGGRCPKKVDSTGCQRPRRGYLAPTIKNAPTIGKWDDDEMDVDGANPQSADTSAIPVSSFLDETKLKLPKVIDWNSLIERLASGPWPATAFDAGSDTFIYPVTIEKEPDEQHQ